MTKALRATLWPVVLMFAVALCTAQTNSDSPTPPQDHPASATPVQPAAPASTRNSGATAASPAETATQPNDAPAGKGSDLYTVRSEVQEVVLHATVIDEHHHPVTGLQRDAFRVIDDGKQQSIHTFRQEDVPVALAIVIDNSGSMREKRAAVNAAALKLVRASNPQDQVCIVNFNNESYLDQDYTGDVDMLKEALEHIESRGGTALYDAVVATSDHLVKTAKLQKKILLVVTDGEDTASHDTLQQAVRAVAVDGGPVIYTIGLLGHEKEKKARRALQALAEQTGGAAYFPGELNEVEAISQQIAHEIRNQYTIGYRPSVAMVPGTYHPVSVKAEVKGYKGLSVRTRSGYYVPAAPTTASK